MKDSTGAASQSLPKCLGGVQGVSLPDIRGDPAVDALLRLRHLLHVVAFAEGGLVAINMIDTYAIGRRRERPRQRLQRTWPDRGDHRRSLAIGPT